MIDPIPANTTGVFSVYDKFVNLIFRPSASEPLCILAILYAAAIKHKFIGLPVKIFTFHNQKLLPFWG